MKKTPLYDNHVAAGAKMVDFAGWRMPIHYGSQIEEHHQVRRDAGMFDVSHMVVVDVHGREARAFLRRLLANDVARLAQPGKALYSCMLNYAGGVIDDLIVYFLADDKFRMVVNAACRNKDLIHMENVAQSFDASIQEREDLSIIAVQGPNAREKVHSVLAATGQGRADASSIQSLGPFFAAEYDRLFIARTGYTGEDGYEILAPNEEAPTLWQALLAVGVEPAGLGARDTLRLEAGMNLYGQDMTEETSPLESGLGWTVALDPEDRQFIGRQALTALRGQEKFKRVGLVLSGRGVLRPHQKVRGVDADGPKNSSGEGETTSGTFSPTLGTAIALARVPVNIGTRCQVEIRGKWQDAAAAKVPFVKKKQPLLYHSLANLLKDARVL